MAKLDISKIRDIYPNYQEGRDISPSILVESMLILQGQETNLTHLVVDASGDVDSLKFQLDKKKKEIESFLERTRVDLIAGDVIPKEFRKNQDLTDSYIKYGSDKSSDYETLVKESFEVEEKLVEARNIFKKYDMLISVVHSAINTSIQVLSYLKQQEKMDGISRNI